MPCLSAVSPVKWTALATSSYNKCKDGVNELMSLVKTQLFPSSGAAATATAAAAAAGDGNDDNGQCEVAVSGLLF